MTRYLIMLSFIITLLSGCAGEQQDTAGAGKHAATGTLQIILIGGPGAGKGTQAAKISEKFGIPHISTGQILRDEVAKGTDLGRRVGAVMQRGELVADSIILRLVEQRLQAPDAQKGFILDGFPRTLAQAQGLEPILERRGDTRLKVILLEVSDEEMLNRLLSRGRADDTPETIQRRIQKYHSETADAIQYDAQKGQLIRINGEQSIEAVAADIENALTP